MRNVTRETALLRFPEHYVGYILEPQDQMTFVHSTIFEQRWHQAGLNREGLRDVSICIMANPGAPAIMEGSFGIRQLQFGNTQRVKSKMSLGVTQLGCKAVGSRIAETIIV